MKQIVYKIGDVPISLDSWIALDSIDRILYIKISPDFEKTAKLSRIEYWIISRVFNRLTNS